MNTKKVLLISDDKDLVDIVKISALTLTKLNFQVSMDVIYDYPEAIKNSKASNLNLIILDYELEELRSLDLISEIRKDRNSKNKKIICLITNNVNKDDLFKAGCDSVMTKDEFKKAINNLLVF